MSSPISGLARDLNWVFLAVLEAAVAMHPILLPALISQMKVIKMTSMTLQVI